ncbi:uncharacterized protein O3Q21_003971 [Podargus strigoides]
MSPEPGELQPQHPDLQLDQVHLRQRQEVHRRRLRDLALSLGGRGRLQPRSATGATQEEGRTEGERSVLPGERSEQRHERELRSICPAAVQLGRLLQGGGLCLHRLWPRVRVWPLHLVLHRASWEGMSPEPGELQPQHPDLQLDQVRLRQRQEVHRRRLRDLALSLGGWGRLQPRSGGRGPRHGAGLVLLWEADGCAAGAGPGTRGSRAGRCRPCPGWRQEPQYPPPVPPRVVFPGRSRRAGVREGLAVEHNRPPHPPRKINTDCPQRPPNRTWAVVSPCVSARCCRLPGKLMYRLQKSAHALWRRSVLPLTEKKPRESAYTRWRVMPRGSVLPLSERKPRGRR